MMKLSVVICLVFAVRCSVVPSRQLRSEVDKVDTLQEHRPWHHKQHRKRGDHHHTDFGEDRRDDTNPSEATQYVYYLQDTLSI